MKEEYKKCGGPAHVGLHLQFIPIDWMDEKTMKEMPICQTNERVKTSDNK